MREKVGCVSEWWVYASKTSTEGETNGHVICGCEQNERKEKVEV